MMVERSHNVLFLCTGNSARSILAEVLINHLGQGRFRGFSAGSFPKGRVHPVALELLQQMNLPTAGLRSKSWNEFASIEAPRMDLVVTVCDNAAGEVCPIWPGQPMTTHWELADPAAIDGEAEQATAFRATFAELEKRLNALIHNFPTVDERRGIANHVSVKT